MHYIKCLKGSHFILKSMSERVGSDVQRLWNWMISRSTQNWIKMTSFKFRVVLCRIRPFTPLFSKIKWLKSGLPFFPCFILWNDHGTNDSYFLSLTDALSDQPNVKSLSDMKPGIISKKIDKNWFSDFKTSFERSKKWIRPCGIFQTWTWKVLFFIQFCTESCGPKLDTFLSI